MQAKVNDAIPFVEAGEFSSGDRLRHLTDLVQRFCGDLLDGAAVLDLARDCAEALTAEPTESEAIELLMLSLRARIERDPVHCRLAARVLCNRLYSEALGTDEFASGFVARYRTAFVDQLLRGIRAGVLDPRLKSFDLDRLTRELIPERDGLLTYMSVQMLEDRYLAREPSGRLLETPQFFWMRMAMGLALVESDSVKTEYAVRFYDSMSALRFLPCTSPTFFHVGTTHPQTGCYVLSLRDDLQHVFETLSTDAKIASLSAGFGNDWTNVSAAPASDQSGGVGPNGTTPFLKVLDSSVAAFNRSGRRHSAACSYLEVWHWDIEEFVDLRRNTGDDRRRVHDISTAAWIPDLFMKRVLTDDAWTLFSPDEVPDLHSAVGRNFEERYRRYEQKAALGQMKLARSIRARDLWQKIITRLFETGHPWITFKDPCNLRSTQDHIGPVGSANLCTEIILNASPDGVGVTTLGSVNLARHARNGKVDWRLLEESVSLGVRILDNALEVSSYPSCEISDYAKKNRPIGLGVLGLQDLLYEIDVPFDSDDGCSVSDELTEFVAFQALSASIELASERGAYSTFSGSKWSRGILPMDTVRLLEEERGSAVDVDRSSRMDWSAARERVMTHGMRNSNLLAIAPTQTLANIAGCYPSIEPAYKQVYVKSNSSGDFTMVNRRLVEDLRARGLWSEDMLDAIKRNDGSIQDLTDIPEDIRRKYRGAFDMDPSWVIEHAARRGKWVDQGQSLNIFTSSTSGSFISDLYVRAWKVGLKTTYYLKTLGASPIEPSTVVVASPRPALAVAAR